MFKKRAISAIMALTLTSGSAFAAGAGGYVTDVDFSFEGPFGSFDSMQLQRGYQVFEQVCAGCHGLKYLAFRDLGREDGPNFPVDQIRAIASQYEVVDQNGEPGDTRPAVASDKFPANDAVGAPDLSLMAKARAGFHGPYGLGLNQLFKGIGGPEYIYSLLMAYTGDDVEVAGNVLYVNEVYPGGLISMSQPLWGDDVEYLVFTESGQMVEELNGYTPPEATQEQLAKDVAAFLMWASEPAMMERKTAGFRNFVMVVLLAVLLYYTNKKLWAPIKRKEA